MSTKPKASKTAHSTSERQATGDVPELDPLAGLRQVLSSSGADVARESAGEALARVASDAGAALAAALKKVNRGEDESGEYKALCEDALRTINAAAAVFRKPPADVQINESGWVFVRESIVAAFLTGVEAAGLAVRTRRHSVSAREAIDQYAALVRSGTGKKGAHLVNARYAEPRAFVQSEWAKHQGDYKGNKTAFARDYAARIKREFGIDVTEKTIRESWLTTGPLANRHVR